MATGKGIARVEERLRSITFESARIAFRNFAGKEGQYNREGDRNFVLILEDPAVAQQMADDGWNIKYLRPREEGDDPTPYVQVSVSYKSRPPRVVMITSRGRTDIPEEMLEILDWVDIASVDLIINPYQWAVNGKTGIKAYLKSIYITIQEDELERKYADVKEIDSAANALTYTKEITDGNDEVIDVEWEDVEDPKYSQDPM